jgi:hypothetical protein
MTLYRANLRLSQELFAVLGMFEVVLRNKIDNHFRHFYRIQAGGDEWLAYAAGANGFYNIPGCYVTRQSILDIISDLGQQYTHDKLVAGLSFGFWRYQFASHEYRASGSNLLRIFTRRPAGTHQTDIFKKLGYINKIRNRIAHHEPVCFGAGSRISTQYALEHYAAITALLQWMDIHPPELLYGIDKVRQEILYINTL